MNIDELEKLIDETNKIFDKKFGIHKDNIDILMSLKIGEEYGELNDAILGLMGLQRGQKMGKYKKANEQVNNELVDIIVTAMGYARRKNIKIKDIIKRLEFIKSRAQKD